ncbi:hypothetical protein HPP92_025742 [Vanilla planifolia]|uniref:Uncharacterized protein n=1 Tax=Vanilla planifolia TaxID=51239 RepID=A0A835PKL0_VANPL|nr:hypothetical protein HPP92_025742 [Vanilla planifolia]
MFGWSTGKSQSLYLLLDHLSDGKEAERSGRRRELQDGHAPSLLALASCILFYTVLSSALRRSVDGSSVAAGGSSVALSGKVGVVVEAEEENAKCCRGLEHLELWGQLLNGELITGLIRRESAAKLAKPCALAPMGPVCAIHGCSVAIGNVAERNLGSVVIETTRGLSDQLRLRDMGLKEHPRENVEGLLCFGTNVQE